MARKPKTLDDSTISPKMAAGLIGIDYETFLYFAKQGKFPQFVTWEEMPSGLAKIIVNRRALQIWLKYGNLSPETMAHIILMKEKELEESA